jgi:hypothetical protein
MSAPGTPLQEPFAPVMVFAISTQVCATATPMTSMDFGQATLVTSAPIFIATAFDASQRALLEKAGFRAPTEESASTVFVCAPIPHLPGLRVSGSARPQQTCLALVMVPAQVTKRAIATAMDSSGSLTGPHVPLAHQAGAVMTAPPHAQWERMQLFAAATANATAEAVCALPATAAMPAHQPTAQRPRASP